MTRFLVLGVFAVLSACSSAGNGAGVDRATSAADLAESLAQENISDPSVLPQRGTASYAGFMTLALPIGGATTDYLGDLDMSVNFAAPRNQVSGTASNFAGLSGDLTIAGGTLDRGTDTDVDFTFDGDVDGVLGQGADSYTIDANLVGEFRGRNQDGLTGVIYGDIDGPAGQDIFQGSIAAERAD